MDHLTALSHKPLTADYCIWLYRPTAETDYMAGVTGPA